MKTTIFQFSTQSFCKTLIYAGLTGMLSLQQIMAMPSITTPKPVKLTTPSPEKLKVLSFTNHNSLMLRVHLENPGQVNVNIQILNKYNEVVYQQKIGRQMVFVGKYSLEQLPDGTYTLLVTSPGQTYTKSFSIQTFTERVVKSPVNAVSKQIQEAI